MSGTRALSSPDDPQYHLLGGVPTDSDAPTLRTAAHAGRRFVKGDANAIFLGTVRLQEQLKRSGQHAPLTMARLLGIRHWQDVSLTRDFFESLTGAILKPTGSGGTPATGDGTVIEAACSYCNLLKEEAVKACAMAAQQVVKLAPGSQAAQQAQERGALCQHLFEQRQPARRDNGKKVDTLRISGSEPEAMVLRLKRGNGFAASYRPSVLTNPD